jgi:nucleoside-diphosphate-sugar epimerase
LFGLSDEHSRVRLDLVANILSMRAAKGLSLTVFGGDQWRPLLHVKDVARAFMYTITHGITGYYNLSYKNYTIQELAKEVADHIPGTKIKYVDMPFEDLRNYKVSSDKFAKQRWKPKYSLKDGVEEMYNLIIQQRIKDTNDTVYFNAKYVKEMENDHSDN